MKNQISPIDDTEMKQLMQKNGVPGLSMAIINSGRCIDHYECGVKDSRAVDAIQKTTIFEAASLSKPVFAYGLLKMVEKGMLDLDRPLSDYARFPDGEHDARLQHITARMVLAHTSGFPNWRPKGQPLKIHFQPGAKFSYSGEGYVYLQKVAEHLSGLCIEKYLQQSVFSCLAMTQSSFVWQDEYENLKASGHGPDGTPTPMDRPRVANSAFTLHTTALDFAKFVMAIMTDSGLKPETIHQMITPQVWVDTTCVNCIEKPCGPLSNTISWGLGWGLQKTAQAEYFWHWGDNGGFKCYIAGCKAQQRAIVVLTNSSNGLCAIPEIINKFWGQPQPAFDWLASETTDF